VGILASKDRPWQLATIDALTSDGGLLDVTTTTRYHRDDWENPVTGAPTVPAHARARALHDLAVTGRSHAWIACVIMDERELLVRRVDRDETAITELIEAETAFWTGNVLPQVEPALTALDRDLVTNVHPIVGAEAVESPAIRALRERREQLADEAAYIKAEMDKIDAEAKHIAGDARTVTADGEPVFSWNYGGSAFDAKTFGAEHPDLLAEFTVTTTRLDWMGLLAEHPEYVGYRSRCIRWHASAPKRKTDPTRSHRAAWSTAA
jgi:predicted phage-related endonuclease